MALTLINDIGGEKSNSYVDIDFGDDYWENHFSASKSAQWAALDDDKKSQLLIQACMVIETARFTEPTDTDSAYHLEYDTVRKQFRSVKNTYGSPVKYFAFQNLQFPTTDTERVDGTLFIPQEIQSAQCEQALFLLNFDDSVLAAQMQGLKQDSVSLGTNSLSATQIYGGKGSAYSPIARAFVAPYILKRTARLERA